MTFLQMWVQGAVAKALGWTLLHSLWEGAVVALALAIVLGVARSSRVRYTAACFALIAMLGGFGVTFYRLMPRDPGGSAAGHNLSAAAPLPSDIEPIASIGAAWDVSDALPWLAPLWMAGVLLFQVRCLASWMAARRLRRVGVCGAPEEWIERLDVLRKRLRLTSAVRLLESGLAEVPVVIGHLRPVILIPVGLLAGLPVGQMESILLHELAHIRRADYVVNLMQTLIEGLMFYHPAAWWISKVIRTERENCCDDLVVATRGNAHEYATALAALAENRWTMRQAAMSAAGGSLVKRIRRLLMQPEGPRAVAPIFSAGILAVTCAVALAAWQSPQLSSPQIAPPPSIKPVPNLIAQAKPSPKPAPVASPFRKWLDEEVVYIITKAERKAFEDLKTDDERRRFIDEFWALRDPTPATPRNEFKEEHYRRIAYANDRFVNKDTPGWKTDRGRIYIQYGPPDEIESHPTGGLYTKPPQEGGGQTVTYPFEQWLYRLMEGIGTNVIIEFVDKEKNGDYRMTLDPHVKDASLFVPKAGITVYRLLGGNGKAVVEISGDRRMEVTIPFEFHAKEYLVTLSALSQDGQSAWSKSELIKNPCEAGPGEASCLENNPRKMTTSAPSPGSYTLKVLVKDSVSLAQNSYTVDVSIAR